MYEKTDITSIGFLQAQYRYYTKSGLDISTLSDDAFCQEIAWLRKIRDLEKDEKIIELMNMNNAGL